MNFFAKHPLRAMRHAAVACVVLTLAACNDAPPPTGTTGPIPSGPLLTAADTAAYLAALRASGVSLQPRFSASASAATVSVLAGDEIKVEVIGLDNGRCENVMVSGAVNTTVFSGIGTPTACAKPAGPVDIGPAESAGTLEFTISSSGAQVQLTPGGPGVYTVAFEDAADGDYNDVVLRVTVTGGQSGFACTPAQPVRGTEVRCALTLPEPYTVKRRTARGNGFRVDETANASQAAGTTYEWKGPAVADTRVRLQVEVVVNGKPNTRRYDAAFTVQERSWPTLQVQAPSVDVGIGTLMSPYPSDGTLGESGPVFPGLGQLPVSRAPAGGPNAGLGYIASPPPHPGFYIRMHPGLYPPPPGLMPGQPGYEPWHKWYNDQNGRGSGTCTQDVFGILTPAAERHEGVTMAPNPQSHWGVAQQAYNDLHPELLIERVYSDDPDATIQRRAENLFVNFHSSGEYRRRQQDFDAVDRPAIVNSLPCTLDFNPNDR